MDKPDTDLAESRRLGFVDRSSETQRNQPLENHNIPLSGASGEGTREPGAYGNALPYLQSISALLPPLLTLRDSAKNPRAPNRKPSHAPQSR